MLKTTFIAIAALGLAGAVTVTPTTPAEAFFVNCKDARYAHTERCVRKAERKARWDAFWAGVFDKRDRDRLVVRKDRRVKGFVKRDHDRVVVKDRRWRLFDKRDRVAAKDDRWSLFHKRDRRVIK